MKNFVCESLEKKGPSISGRDKNAVFDYLFTKKFLRTENFGKSYKLSRSVLVHLPADSDRQFSSSVITPLIRGRDKNTGFYTLFMKKLS